jgi:hypothetical protein
VTSCQAHPRSTTRIGISPKYSNSTGAKVVATNSATFEMMIHLTANVIGPGPKE